MNNSSNLETALQTFDFSADEAKIYLELLREPSTHLALSQSTSINRTKVYRIVQDLEQRSLVTRQTDDRGTFLHACDASTLEILVAEQEHRAMEQRGVFQELLPSLHAIQSQDTSLFATRTYDGIEGLKQMCWHELKAKDELLVFGAGSIEDMIPNRYWAEKHRSINVASGYRVLEIVNANSLDPKAQATFTENRQFMQLYEHRVLPSEILELTNQVTIYNDTVAVYHWREDKKSGVEIINKPYAAMMRQMFRYYWQIAGAITPPSAKS